MRIDAPAKINLFLSVGARRSNGLHELVSVMQAVSLTDEVTLERAGALQLEVEPSGSAPADAGNIAARAAVALGTLQGIEPGVAIHLRNRIPVAAGLGGGSADAAAVLLGLKRLWNAGISRKALERIAAELGSDVPFCVRGGTAVVSGTGEEVISLAVGRPLWWVLGLSGEQLSTADVYTAFDGLGGGSPGDPLALADALARGDLDRIASELRNDLAPAAFSLAPRIEHGGGALLEAGALGAVLSGSGPSWLGLAHDEAHAQNLAARCAGAFARAEVVSSLSRGPRVLDASA
jgi:4-diphosphocytidyl-2-C-methyl-D-erythritol kinase